MMLLPQTVNVAVKLNFADLDDSQEDITDIERPISPVSDRLDDCNNNIAVPLVCSTPHTVSSSHVKRLQRPVPRSIRNGVRCLKLFSPESPQTNIQDSNSTKCRRTQLRSRITDKQTESSPYNINPFTPSGMYLSSRRRAQKPSSDCNMSIESEESGIEMAQPVFDEIPELENVSADVIESTLSKSRRLTIDDVNINRYNKEFIEFGPIGKGDFGGVFKCKHRLDGCLYAIKKSQIPIPGSFKERVALNDVYAHAVLGKHPHVVRYYSSWTEEDLMIIQNEYCNGGSLLQKMEDRWSKNLTFSSAELKQILLHIAKGLRYIHAKRLVHLDIKPDNIFIVKEPIGCGNSSLNLSNHYEEAFEDNEAELTYKIGDLGLVTSLVNPKVEEGDCRYLASELIHEGHSHLTKADIFALGMTIYETALGKRLPPNGHMWHSYRSELLPPVMGLADDMLDLLRLMCHADPLKRPSAAELIEMVAQIHPVSKTQNQLQQEVKNLRTREEVLSHNLLEAARYLQSINPSMAQNLLSVVQPRSPGPGATMIHEPYTPPKEPTPVKEHQTKILRRGSTRVHKKISPIQTRRQISKRFKVSTGT